MSWKREGLTEEELAHMTDEWMDWQKDHLRVPGQDAEDVARRPDDSREHPRTIRRLRDFFG